METSKTVRQTDLLLEAYIFINYLIADKQKKWLIDKNKTNKRYQCSIQSYDVE